jgi:hypothetical protein
MYGTVLINLCRYLLSFFVLLLTACFSMEYRTYYKAWVQVLHGLDFLHANNVVHRSVTVS